MSDFAFAGWKVLQDYIVMQLAPHIYPEGVTRPDFNRVYWLCAKLKELLILLHPTPIVFPNTGISVMGFQTQDSSSILKHMEDSFADEITEFYYINLYNDSNIRVKEPRNYYDSLPNDDSFKPSDTPKQCLSRLLERDKGEPLIKERLSKWRDDLLSLQSGVLDNIKAIV